MNQKPQKWWIASDHAGYALKQHLLKTVLATPLECRDLGPDSEESVDYPDFADRVAEALKQEPDGFGILICGSGQGMAIRANRYSHLRATLCCNTEWARLAREHNNANVLCLGGRLTSPEQAEEIFKVFSTTEFAGGRHLRRVEKL